MAKNSFLQAIFPRIKYSVSPFQKTSKGNTKLGKVIPVYATMLNGKEGVSIDLGHLVRFAPSIVPTMEGYEVNFEAFKVSLNAIAYSQRKERELMDFHNFALNDGTEVNPLSHRIELVQPRIDGSHNGVVQADFFSPGLLGDYLNFPSMKSFRKYVREWITKTPLFDGDITGWSIRDLRDAQLFDAFVEFYQRRYLNYRGVFEDQDGYSSFENSTLYYAVPFRPTFEDNSYPYADQWTNDNYLGLCFANDVTPTEDLFPFSFYIDGVPSLLGYICEKYPLVEDYYNFAEHRNLSDYNPSSWLDWVKLRSQSDPSFTLNYLDVLYQLYKVDAQSIFDEWFNFIMRTLLFNNVLQQCSTQGLNSSSTLMTAGWLPNIYGSDMKPIDWTYFAAYWKIISDWYINTNIDGDPDTFFLNRAHLFGESNLFVELEPFTRRWPNDIFTSAVPSSKVQNVLIPADGTIPDFREANAYQKFKDILRNTGNRLRDVLFGVRGYRPTAEASHMSVPVGTLHSYVGMSSILQTTPTDSKSAQGSYAGVGTDSSGGNYRHILKVVNNDEPVPVVVMVLMSVTQRATYMQGFPRNFFRSSIYDFAVPQLANIGEQEVNLSELYFDYDAQGEAASLDTVFGFNRRYYDWFFEQNEVHGDLRDTEDFWTGARIFDSRPALNAEFIGIENEKDQLSRIFANTSPSSRPIYYNVMFEGEKIVALPRYIQYDL